MTHERPTLETRVEALARRLESVERRLIALEAPATGGAVAAVAPTVVPAPPPRTAGGWHGTVALQRFGRTLVVFGGAFLLRAITEAGVLPQAVGTAFGLAYAMFWVVQVDRAASRRRLRSATFHGLAATGIAFPLLWEATVKFGFLPPWAGAVALAALTGAALFVVNRRRLRGLAWLVALSSAVTLLALAGPSKMWSLFVLELLLLALAVMWLGYARGWQPLAWTVGGVLTLTLAQLAMIALSAPPDRVARLFSPEALLALQLGWVAGFFGTLGYRKLAGREELTPGEIALASAVLVVGFGGAVLVSRSTSVPATWLGAVSLVLAAGFYGVAFAVADRRQARRTGFVFYSTLGLAVTLFASAALLPGNALTVVCAAAALLTAWLGSRRKRATLSLHGAVYILAAAANSGLLSNGIGALAATAAPSPRWITPYVLIVLAVAGVFFSLPIAPHGRTWGRFSRASMLAVIVVLAVGFGAIATCLGVRLLGAGTDAANDAGALAALRTGVFAASAVLLAWLSRKPRWPEALWLVYPALALGGVELLFGGLRSGRPATLFFSFVLFGAALIVAPRLARHASPDAREG